MYVILSIATILYFLAASKQDIKERMIYTFPIAMLHASWGIYLLFNSDWGDVELSLFWIIHLVIYILFNRFGIWGAGDSDLFVLFADICLASGISDNMYGLVFLECILLAIGLLLALVVGSIEAHLKGKKIDMNKKIALTPGMGIVVITLIVRGFVWRL